MTVASQEEPIAVPRTSNAHSSTQGRNGKSKKGQGSKKGKSARTKHKFGNTEQLLVGDEGSVVKGTPVSLIEEM